MFLESKCNQLRGSAVHLSATRVSDKELEDTGQYFPSFTLTGRRLFIIKIAKFNTICTGAEAD